MTLSLKIAGQTKKVDLSDTVFATKFNESLIHQVVTAYLAGARSGNSAQKTRAEVSGGGKKPWKQKGGGRARAGSSRGPIWRGGGVTFASKPRDYTQKVNKKMYRVAMRSIFAELYRQDRLKVVASLALESNKTKDLLKKLKELEVERVLLISDDVSENLYLASRNLPNVDVSDVVGVNPWSLLRVDHVVLTPEALQKIEEKFK